MVSQPLQGSLLEPQETWAENQKLPLINEKSRLISDRSLDIEKPPSTSVLCFDIDDEQLFNMSIMMKLYTSGVNQAL